MTNVTPYEYFTHLLFFLLCVFSGSLLHKRQQQFLTFFIWVDLKGNVDNLLCLP